MMSCRLMYKNTGVLVADHSYQWAFAVSTAGPLPSCKVLASRSLEMQSSITDVPKHKMPMEYGMSMAVAWYVLIWPSYGVVHYHLLYRDKGPIFWVWWSQKTPGLWGGCTSFSVQCYLVADAPESVLSATSHGKLAAVLYSAYVLTCKI
jgi:hypothetical protein